MGEPAELILDRKFSLSSHEEILLRRSTEVKSVRKKPERRCSFSGSHRHFCLFLLQQILQKEFACENKMCTFRYVVRLVKILTW